MLPKHILVIRLSAMGDVAMTVPVLRAFSIKFPDVKLTILTKKSFRPIFKDLKNVSVIDADVKGKHKGILGLWKLSRELKTLNIEAVADLHNVLRSNILKLFISTSSFKQIDKGRSEKKQLVSGKQFKQLKSTHERYLDVFNNLGFNFDLENPDFLEKYELESSTKEILGTYSSLVGVAPFAAFKGKTYPLNLMEKVIKTLSETNKVILFGGKNESSQLERIASNYNSVVNVAGKLDFEEELNLISNLNLMISMDSGNAHLAAMYGVETITIWGVTHPYAGFSPFNQNKDNAILADRTKFPEIPTSIYGNKYPIGYEKAIATISPSQIIDKANSLLNG